MNEQFIESMVNIREESLGMIKTLRAVKGENHARLVHAIILADQIDNIGNVFSSSASQETRPTAEALRQAQMNMVALIMKYLFRATQFSDSQISEAFADAERIQKSTYSLVETAGALSDQGKVMGS